MKCMAAAMKVNGVVVDGGTGDPVVILEEVGRKRYLEVPVGPFEASAVIIELEGITPPRPLTHDLIVSLFRTHGFTLDYVDFYAVNGPDFLARMVYHAGERRHEQEIRPSDGLALSVRMQAPVFADESVMLLRAKYGDTRLESEVEIEELKADWSPRQ